MKKRVLIFTVLFLLAANLTGAASGDCDLQATLLNQDPYPAVPSEYVKVVFQLTGIDNPSCGKITFELMEQYPFSLNPGTSNSIEIDSGAYARNFESSLIIPYELRVHENALDGDNPIEVGIHYTSSEGSTFTQLERFNINVDGVEVEFEVSVKDFDPTTNTLTFEILNIGEKDVEALVAEIPKQENIEVKGSNREIVGDLDSAEDTTFNFEAVPKDGNIEIVILYNDEIDVRRRSTMNVPYDSSYFTNRKKDESQGQSPYLYILIIVIILIGIWIYWSRRKRKKRLDGFNHSEKRK